jgi:hypothetical protein
VALRISDVGLLRRRVRHRQLTFERSIEHGPRRLEERLKPGR